MALSTMAFIVTSRASSGSRLFALASIISVRRFWSRLPQFTPMRTGLPLSMATWTMARKLSSWCLPPTLPGLMRYLARALRAVGILDEENVPVVVEVADDRAPPPGSTIVGNGAGRRVGVHGDAHQLAARRVERARPARPCRPRPAVSVLVMDWTTMGRSPPTLHPAHVHHHALPTTQSTHDAYLTITPVGSRPPCHTSPRAGSHAVSDTFRKATLGGAGPSARRTRIDRRRRTGPRWSGGGKFGLSCL